MICVTLWKYDFEMTEEMKYIFEGAEGASFRNLGEVEMPEGVRLVMPQQTHTVNVGVVTSPDGVYAETDALITQLTDVAVGVRTADCVPVILYAPDIKAVAAVHAGWKGTVGRIVANTIGKLKDMGGNPELMTAAFGPSICGECYETGRDLAEKFVGAGLGEAVIWGKGEDPIGEKTFGEETVRIDLQKANMIIIKESGIPAENIHPSTECTRHSTRHWPSWRRMAGTADRLVTAIRLTR